MLNIIAMGGDMRNLSIILLGLCFVFAGNKSSINTVVFSGDNLIKLTSQKNQLDLKRKSDITSLKKKDDISTEKRRHKRRRKVRPPKQGK
jgi:hypothetical protein